MSFFDYTLLHTFYKDPSIKNIVVSEKTSSITITIDRPNAFHPCPFCHTRTNKVKDYRWQKVRDIPWGEHTIFLFFHKRRYSCPHCGKTFYAPDPLLSRYQRLTPRLNKMLLQELTRVQSCQEIATRYRCSTSVITRRLDKIHFTPPHLADCLSIDEFRGNAGGEKFQCLLTDPLHKQVLDVLPHRTTDPLLAYFRRFSWRERAKVKWISMDMSPLFRSVVKPLFPHAEIVADRFHVVRSVVTALEEVRKQVQQWFYATKRKWFKRSRYLLLKQASKLTTKDKDRLHVMLEQSETLSAAYALKEAFFAIFRAKELREAKDKLRNWLHLVETMGLLPFKKCATGFRNWSREIVNMIRFREISNGFTEGMNNKIKVLKRICYGMRKVERFRTRILLLHR